MIKAITLLITCLACASQANAQSFSWARSFGSSGWDEGQSVTVDAAGNVYSTGYFEGTVDFDPGPGTFNLTSAGGSDIYVQKLDASGNFLWAASFGSTNNDEGYALHLDGAGNPCVTGSFQGTVDFDPGPGTMNRSAVGGEDVFVLKLDASGALLWARSFGGNGDDDGYGLFVDGSDHVYTTGSFEGTVDLDPGAGTANQTSAGGDDVFVQKLDAAGNFLWARSYGGNADDAGHAISVDGSGNVHTTGYFTGTADLDPGTGTLNLASAGATDVFVQKLNASGALLWAVTFGGVAADEGNSVTVDASGTVYSTGSFSNTVDFDPGPGNQNRTSAGMTDVYIQTLNASGNFQWVVTFGDEDEDEGNAVRLDNAGHVYTTGSFEGTVDVDPGPGTTNLNAPDSEDVFIQCLNSNGGLLWAVSFGGSDDDEAYSIHVDGPGSNIHTTGYFNGTADFEPGPGTTNLSSQGAADAFVHKLGSIQTNIQELKAEIATIVHPNPTNGWIQLAFEEEQFDVVLTLSDMQGKVVLTRELGAVLTMPMELDVRPGIYLLTVMSPSGQRAIRLVKE